MREKQILTLIDQVSQVPNDLLKKSMHRVISQYLTKSVMNKNTDEVAQALAVFSIALHIQELRQKSNTRKQEIHHESK